MINPEEKVKVGDLLAEQRGRYGLCIVKVERVTPTGQIVLDDRRRYRSDGSIIGDKWTPSTLSLLTPKIRLALMRQDNIGKLRSTEWENIENDKLQKIVDILNRKDA